MIQSRSLVGYILSSKPFNLRALSSAFNGAWRLSKGFTLDEAVSSLFVCEFQSRGDKIKVLYDGPWHYDRQLIVFGTITLLHLTPVHRRSQ